MNTLSLFMLLRRAAAVTIYILMSLLSIVSTLSAQNSRNHRITIDIYLLNIESRSPEENVYLFDLKNSTYAERKAQVLLIADSCYLFTLKEPQVELSYYSGDVTLKSWKWRLADKTDRLFAEDFADSAGHNLRNETDFSVYLDTLLSYARSGKAGDWVETETGRFKVLYYGVSPAFSRLKPELESIKDKAAVILNGLKDIKPPDPEKKFQGLFWTWSLKELGLLILPIVLVLISVVVIIKSWITLKRVRRPGPSGRYRINKLNKLLDHAINSLKHKQDCSEKYFKFLEQLLKEILTVETRQIAGVIKDDTVTLNLIKELGRNKESKYIKTLGAQITNRRWHYLHFYDFDVLGQKKDQAISHYHDIKQGHMFYYQASHIFQLLGGTAEEKERILQKDPGYFWEKMKKVYDKKTPAEFKERKLTPEQSFIVLMECLKGAERLSEELENINREKEKFSSDISTFRQAIGIFSELNLAPEVYGNFFEEKMEILRRITHNDRWGEFKRTLNAAHQGPCLLQLRDVLKNANIEQNAEYIPEFEESGERSTLIKVCRSIFDGPSLAQEVTDMLYWFYRGTLLKFDDNDFLNADNLLRMDKLDKLTEGILKDKAQKLVTPLLKAPLILDKYARALLDLEFAASESKSKRLQAFNSFYLVVCRARKILVDLLKRTGLEYDLEVKLFQKRPEGAQKMLGLDAQSSLYATSGLLRDNFKEKFLATVLKVHGLAADKMEAVVDISQWGVRRRGEGAESRFLWPTKVFVFEDNYVYLGKAVGSTSHRKPEPTLTSMAPEQIAKDVVGQTQETEEGVAEHSLEDKTPDREAGAGETSPEPEAGATLDEETGYEADSEHKDKNDIEPDEDQFNPAS